ncbi:hypothetical protein CHELA20_51372 [Hyphomicrobiales bacterium]|nr:hypothetical protein CHELA41_23643 [Hyphomicrobiales bacterium]CAH1675594.1 hypothetical protein CHELA20_51372 [Hyphomicrobiales bacterium]
MAIACRSWKAKPGKPGLTTAAGITRTESAFSQLNVDWLNPRRALTFRCVSGREEMFVRVVNERPQFPGSGLV